MDKKIKFKLPSTCALLFMLMITAAVLTWIIPAGEYETEQIGSTTRVIAGTYHTVTQNPQGLWDLFTIRYMESVKCNPAETSYSSALTRRHMLSLLGFLLAVAALLIGCAAAGWSHDQITAVFFALTIFLGLINGMGINGTMSTFLNGCSKMIIRRQYSIGSFQPTPTPRIWLQVPPTWRKYPGICQPVPFSLLPHRKKYPFTPGSSPLSERPAVPIREH